MLIPRDVWELAATVPLPKILKTSSPSTPTTLSTSGEPLKPTLPTSGDPLKPAEPVSSSLLQQSSAILLKSSTEAAPSSQTTVEDWIAEAPWVDVSTQSLRSYGSDSPGREFWPKCGPFLRKVEPSCDQTVKDRYDFSIDLG